MQKLAKFVELYKMVKQDEMIQLDNKRKLAELARLGLSSISSIKCSFCGHLNEVKSSAEHRAGSRGPLVSMRNTHLNNLLSTMNIPTMNHNLFKRRDREVGNALENVAVR